MTEKNTQKCAPKKFVERVISRLKTDNGFRAAMTRADHESTAPQAWRFLIELGNVDLENEPERLAFALVGAAMARERTESNGTQSLGEALKACKSGPEDESIERRLRRILACDERMELIAVLRHTIRFVNSKNVGLDYELLLRNILYFGDRVKVQWAKDYYGRSQDDSSVSAGSEEKEEA